MSQEECRLPSPRVLGGQGREEAGFQLLLTDMSPRGPPGCFIEDILQNWRTDYDLLEENHSYIQW